MARGGADWFNDSIATAPERTLAALHSFEQPVVLLLGGRDKGLPWELLFAELRRRVDHVVFFGELGPVMAGKLGTPRPPAGGPPCPPPAPRGHPGRFLRRAGPSQGGEAGHAAPGPAARDDRSG